MVESKKRSADFCGISFNPDAVLEHALESKDALDYTILEVSAEDLRSKCAYLKSWEKKVKPDNLVGKISFSFFSTPALTFASNADFIFNQSEEENVQIMAATSFPISFNELNRLDKRHVSSRIFVAALGSNQDALDTEEQTKKALLRDEFRAEDGFVHLTRANLESGILEKIHKSISKSMFIIEGLKPEYSVPLSNPTEPIFIGNDGRRADVFLAHAFKLSEDALDAIQEHSSALKDVLALQYEMFFARAVSQFLTPDTIHAYPLLDMSNPKLERMNLDAFSQAVTSFFAFSFRIHILFHYDVHTADISQAISDFIPQLNSKFIIETRNHESMTEDGELFVIVDCFTPADGSN